MLIAPHSRLVMIGDSITDCGRSPDGEGNNDAIGNGYVRLVDALLGTSYPAHAIRVTNMGIGGNTVRNLEERWQRDVVDRKPDWLSIMIGINDVWRQFDLPRQPERHVLPDAYAARLERLVAAIRPTLAGLVLMSPFYIEPNRDDAMRRQMDRYGGIMKEIAQQHDAIFVDTQAAFDTLLEHYYPATLAWDRVHPNHIGHMAIARAFLQGVGFEWGR